DQSWSWAYDSKDSFPRVVGQPYYVDSYTRNVLPVKLEPNREYVIWVNSKFYKSFMDRGGISALPFRFQFATGELR
ncbi:RNA polymerase sigma factor, partial [Thermodesulfobacteriota bacterium]